jgi:predicted glycosyltransferase involved in capsule biosynthesis
MGYSRNFALAQCRGEIVLFLDDDTVILQHDFLSIVDRLFRDNPEVDAVVPHGHASFATLPDQYDFHDDFFMTSRCTAYRRQVLKELAGFQDSFVGQEDVEFVTRFTIAGKKALNAEELHYFHPPLLVPNLRKPAAVGVSFFNLKGSYPFLIWLALLANCARHAPLYLVPIRKYREMGRFGLGFLRGVWIGLTGRGDVRYG